MAFLRALSVDLDETQAVMKKDLIALLAKAQGKAADSLAEELEAFEGLFHQYLVDRRAAASTVTWDKIENLPSSAVKSYGEDIPEVNMSQAKDLLNKLVVLKLNGGLGTSMGCQGPKSLITVRNDQTFLDLTVRQIETLNQQYGCHVPLVLMNSFYTHEDTLKIKPKYERRVKLHMFVQSCYPRIDRETLRPLADSPKSSDECWYPPGHGDVYQSIQRSGLLDRFISEGKEIIFISNIDNLGATVDLKLLNFLLNPKPATELCEYAMEVTDKTRADVKGGTLIQYEGRLRLLELAQVPKDKVDEFKSISKFKIFNTNNLWVSLKAIDRLLKADELKMEVIVNPKSLDGGTNIIQLEMAAGAAIKNFAGAVGINVPRSRFLPVKKTSDLLLVMSNLYQIRPQGSLVMNEARSFPVAPLVKLGDLNFGKVKEFLRRFDTIPDMLELDHLTVSGDVTFGKGVTLKGTVIIIANHGERIDIPSGAILENKIVSGNLRILDH